MQDFSWWYVLRTPFDDPEQIEPRRRWMAPVVFLILFALCVLSGCVMHQPPAEIAAPEERPADVSREACAIDGC